MERREHGLSWAFAGQALTPPLGEIAINPWGPIAEVRQVPRSTSLSATRSIPIEAPGTAAPEALRAKRSPMPSARPASLVYYVSCLSRELGIVTLSTTLTEALTGLEAAAY